MIKPDGDMGEADESDLDEEYSKTGGGWGWRRRESNHVL